MSLCMGQGMVMQNAVRALLSQDTRQDIHWLNGHPLLPVLCGLRSAPPVPPTTTSVVFTHHGHTMQQKQFVLCL